MMLLSVYHAPFFLGMATPEQENNAFTFLVELGNHMIGKTLPTKIGMGMGLARLDRQDRIKQQHALLGPRDQVTMVGDAKSRNILDQLLVDIDQRRRGLDARTDRKAEAMGLIRPVIGICPRITTFTSSNSVYLNALNTSVAGG